jgi:hypothetical protein
MKSRSVIYLTVALTAVLVAAVSFAAVPQTISYQGFLAHSGGVPVNGAVNMTFSLYTLPTGTVSQVWTETQTGVAVTSGQYSVVLGSVTPLAIPFDVPYYLGVTVGSDAEMTPRLPLTSTGYAFRAAQADGVSSSATLTAMNAIVSTVPTGVAPLQVSSTTLVPNLNADMVGGMHATDFVAKAGDTMTGNLTVPSATLTGILTLPPTSATVGIIMQGGNRLIHTYGNNNFFAGTNAGNLTMAGFNNTASGNGALSSNNTGTSNTAIGNYALSNNTSGSGNTAVGYAALNRNDQGDYNTAIGYWALFQNSGDRNTANGWMALEYNTSGRGNTAIGSQALFRNGNGDYNTAVGDAALYTNGGSQNTASGYQALYSNYSGGQNTAGGYQALYNNVGGSGNTASGYQALYNNTSGGGNTAVGYWALYSNTTGTSNIALGSAALKANISGVGNIASGYGALAFNETGNFNTASGHHALYHNTTANSNTASGARALYSNTTGESNTAIGVDAMYSNITGQYNTAIGGGALESNISGHYNIAIGNGAFSENGGSGNGNIAIGHTALWFCTTCNSNTIVGTEALAGGGFDNITSSTAIGARTEIWNDVSNATVIGAGAYVNDSNKVRIGNTSVAVIEGAVGFSHPSDIRIKKDISEIGYGLSFIKQLRPVQFRMKDGNDRIDFGFIAQDIEALLGTKYNILGIDPTEERMLSLRDTDFIAPMVKSMQEQQVIIDDLKARIEKLEALLAAQP